MARSEIDENPVVAYVDPVRFEEGAEFVVGGFPLMGVVSGPHLCVLVDCSGLPESVENHQKFLCVEVPIVGS